MPFESEKTKEKSNNNNNTLKICGESFEILSAVTTIALHITLKR